MNNFLFLALSFLVFIIIGACTETQIQVSPPKPPVRPPSVLPSSFYTPIPKPQIVPFRLYWKSGYESLDTYHGQIKIAIDEWNVAVGKEVVTFNQGPGKKVEISTIGPKKISDCCIAAGLAYVWGDPYRIEFYNALEVDSIRVVALHELGHIFGLEHTDDKNDVMYGKLGGAIILSQNDIQRAKFSLKALENVNEGTNRISKEAHQGNSLALVWGKLYNP